MHVRWCWCALVCICRYRYTHIYTARLHHFRRWAAQIKCTPSCSRHVCVCVCVCVGVCVCVRVLVCLCGYSYIHIYTYIFVYTQLIYTIIDDNHREKFVYRHVLGTSQDADPLIYEELDDGFFLGVGLTESERYLYGFAWQYVIFTNSPYVRGTCNGYFYVWKLMWGWQSGMYVVLQRHVWYTCTLHLDPGIDQELDVGFFLGLWRIESGRRVFFLIEQIYNMYIRMSAYRCIFMFMCFILMVTMSSMLAAFCMLAWQNQSVLYIPVFIYLHGMIRYAYISTCVCTFVLTWGGYD